MVKILFYTKEEQFINKILMNLNANEALNNKIIDTLAACKKQIDKGIEGNFIAYTFEKSKIINVFICANYRLMISGAASRDSMELVVDWAINNKKKIDKIFGPLNLVERCVSLLKEKKNVDFNTYLATYLMKLTALKPTSYTEGIVRKAEKEDTDDVSILIHDFLAEALSIADMAMAKKKAENLIGKERIYLLEVNKEIVCMAAMTRILTKNIAISYVYTKKTARGKGYATKCVGELSKLILTERNKHCILFADKANPNSQKVYLNLGYETIGEFTEVALHEN